MASIVYHHIELAEHDVIIAEGLTVESYLDAGGRADFSDHRGPVTSYPKFTARRWETAGYAPFVVRGAILAGVRAKLARRAGNNADQRSVRWPAGNESPGRCGGAMV